MIITGKTESGFEFGIDKRTLSDFRYLTILTKLQKAASEDDDMTVISSTVEMLRFVLGDEQLQKFYKHIAEKNDGFVPSEAVMAEFDNIIKTSTELKN